MQNKSDRADDRAYDRVELNLTFMQALFHPYTISSIDYICFIMGAIFKLLKQ